MTEKLFYVDAYATEFEATVASYESKNGKFAVLLDRTLFYPTGGGQPCDTGTIGGIEVIDVYEKDGDIFHVTNVPVSGTVKGIINWSRRFSLMQNHSGEHIISGIVNKRFGFDNVGFHMGSDFITIDINGFLDQKQLDFIEEESNKAVYENVPISAKFYSEEEVKEISYRSKKPISGEIRIVYTGDYDSCACCGTHCKTAGEIGIIKIINSEKYKSGVRLYILCGFRALADYTAKNNSVYAISKLLSVKPAECVSEVQKLLEKFNTMKFENTKLRRAALAEKAKQLCDTEHDSVYAIYDEISDSDELAYLCEQICETKKRAVVFAGIEGNYKYVVGAEVDAVAEAKKINTLLRGRGGGKGRFCRGIVSCSAQEIADFAQENGYA